MRAGRPRPCALGPEWDKHEHAIRAELKETEGRRRREALIARGRIRAGDAGHDRAMGRLGVRVLAASGGNPKEPPYNVVFSHVTVKEVQGMGAVNASIEGPKVARRAEEGDPRFKADAARVRAYAHLLQLAAQGRTAVDEAEAVEGVRRLKLNRQLEDLVAATEHAILGFLPRTEAKAMIVQLLSRTAAGR